MAAGQSKGGCQRITVRNQQETALPDKVGGGVPPGRKAEAKPVPLGAYKEDMSSGTASNTLGSFVSLGHYREASQLTKLAKTS